MYERRGGVLRQQVEDGTADRRGVDAPPPFSDEVADGVRGGDPDALAVVFRELVGPLTGWLRTQVSDPHLAEDVANETFLELVRGCRGIAGGPFAIRAWVYRAARRNVLDAARTRRRHPEQLGAVDHDRPDGSADPALHALESEAGARVRAALGRISTDQAQVLALRFLGELSAPEVARVLGKREGAVRALQHRGVAALAQVLREMGVPEEAPAAPEGRRNVTGEFEGAA